MSAESPDTSADDRVARAMQAIVRLQEDAEAVAAAHGVPLDGAVPQPVRRPLPKAPVPAAPVAETLPVDPADSILSGATASMGALTERILDTGTLMLVGWRQQSEAAFDQWRSTAEDALEELVRSAEESADEAGAALERARVRLTELGR